MSDKSFKPVIAPAPNFVLGHALNFNEDSIKMVQEMAQYGDFVRARVLHRWINFIFHPDLVHDYLIRKAKHFDKAKMLKDSGKDIIQNNIFAADGDHWKKQHKLMMPAFHAQRIGAYADDMIAYTKQATAGWETGTQVDMDMEMMQLTMRIITKTMFDLELGSDGEDLEEIGHLVEDMFNIFGERMTKPFILPTWFPTAQNRRMSEIRVALYEIMSKAVEKWRETGEDTGDLLSMLMLAEYDDGSKMDDKTLFRELVTIFGAGHETTAHTLAYTFYALATNPDVKAKLQHELDTVLQGETASLETVDDLPYTMMVIKEAMRMYPVAQGVIREPNQPTDLCGVPIDRGDIVFAPSWAIHHDARWYPQPEQFRPERFSRENENDIPKYAYIPFGGGPRVCIGNQFALLEARLVLATIMQRFDVSVPDDYTLNPESAFTTRPQGGVPMTIAVREDVPQQVS